MKRKKWLIAAFSIPLLALLSLHTQPVERAIWRKVVAEARQVGVELSAARFDLNLLTLSISLRDLWVKHEAVEARLARVSVNGGFDLLFGAIDIDAFEIAEGEVRIKPASGAAEPAPETAPAQIPPVRLGRGTIDRVAIRVGDQSVLVAADDLQLDFLDGKLNLRLRTRENLVQGAQIPELALSLYAETRQFQGFETIRLSAVSERSRIHLRGKLNPGFEPHLKLTAILGEDAPVGFPVSFESNVTPERVALLAVGELPFQGEVLPVRAQTEFDYRTPAPEIPLALSAGDLAAGLLTVRLADGDLGGALALTGNPAALKRAFPFLDPEAVSIAADFAMLGMDPARLQARAEVATQGRPALAVDAVWRDGSLRFEGEGAAMPGSSLRFSGVFGRELEAKVDLEMAGLENLNSYVALPKALCSGPVSVHARGRHGTSGWHVDDFRLQASQAAFLPYIADDLTIQAAGPIDQLTGALMSRTLNSEGPAARFTFNAQELSWDAISLDLNTRRVPLVGFDWRVRGQVSGQGPVGAPAIEGALTARLFQPESDQRFVEVETSFDWEDKRLRVSGLDARGAHGRLHGQGELNYRETMIWMAEADLDVREDEGFEPTPGLELPELTVRVAGNQDLMRARIIMPDQVFELPEAAFPLSSQSSNRAHIDPDALSVDGVMPQLEIAGVLFHELAFTVAENRLYAAARYDLRDPEALETALARFWPADLDLAAAEGRAIFESDLGFESPQLALELERGAGGYAGESFDLLDVKALYGEQGVEFEPFGLRFAGMMAQVAPAPARGEKLAVLARFGLEDGERLRSFLGTSWPEDLTLERFHGEALLYDDLTFAAPDFSFRVDSLKADYDGRVIESDSLTGSYGDGLKLGPGSLWLENIEVALSDREDGFALRANPTAGDIGDWLPGFVGDAAFDLDVSWRNVDGSPEVDASLVQLGGRLIREDPWIELVGLKLRLSSDGLSKYAIKQGEGKLNGGSLEASGSFDFSGEQPELELNLYANEVEVDLVDYRANLDAAVELVLDDQQRRVNSSVFIRNAYLNPKFELREFVEDLIADTTELYFPDPFLETIELQAYIASQKPHPVVLESELGYIELETPSLLFQGSLAQPEIASGMVIVNEGSYLDLGRRSYIFNPSQVQFHVNREDDPYLQISLRPADPEDKNVISLNGYVSDLDHNIETTNVMGIIGTYLLGNVFSQVSLEAESTGTLFDSVYTIVVSERFSRKVVARYAFPVLGDTKTQRAEINFGPFDSNFLNFSNQEDQSFGVGLRHSRKWGYVDEQRPLIVRKMTFAMEDAPPHLERRKVKRQFKLQRGDIYSQTFWRRARQDLARRLRRSGYLDAAIDHRYEKGVLAVEVAPGRRTELFIEGLEVSEAEKKELLTYLRDASEASLRNVSLQVQRMALSKGYSSAAALTRLEGGDVYVEALLGNRLDEAFVDFGAADAVLGPLYQQNKDRRDMVTRYLSDAKGVKDKLRAQLAAKGYLEPQFGEGGFEDVNRLRIPIEPGPRAVLSRIYDGDQSLADEWVGQPFDYALIGQVAETLQRDHPGVKITVAPRRDGNNVALEVARREIVDPVVSELAIQGNRLISSRKIERFLDFEPNMPQGQLIKAQKRLVDAGQFRIARLQTAEEAAVLEVGERNRYDIDFELSWSEAKDFGSGLQFKDYQLFRGFNRLAANLRRTEEEESVLARTQFLRVWGTPFDVSLGLNWSRDLEDPNPQTVILEGGEFTAIEKQERRKLDLNVSYPLTDYQRLNFGASYRENMVDATFTPDPGPAFSPVGAGRFRLLPLQASWLFRKFDHPSNPRNGALAIFSLDQYLSSLGSDDDFLGTRLNGKLTYFKAWGPVIWTQRVEAGYYVRTEDSVRVFPDTDDISPLFFLGSANDVRGFDNHFLGPIEEGAPVGGEALFFASQELSIDLGYLGLGLSPFVDGGWVWAEREDFLNDDLAISGGLGLYWNSPVGYFRIDWARPINDDPFEAQLLRFSPAERDRIRNRALSEISFRFGRVF